MGSIFTYELVYDPFYTEIWKNGQRDEMQGKVNRCIGEVALGGGYVLVNTEVILKELR
jgi:hypothetical protein